MKKNKTLEMVQLAVLIAIMLILAFTPLGYLRIGPLAISLMTRTLMGWLSGVIFKALWKIDKTKTVTYFVTGLLGAFMNTLFFMSTLMICFGHTEYLQSMNATGANLFMFAVAFCGINGALEMPMSCVVGGGVAKAVSVALKKNAATEEK